MSTALAQVLEECIPYIERDEFNHIVYQAISGLHDYIGKHAGIKKPLESKPCFQRSSQEDIVASGWIEEMVPTNIKAKPTASKTIQWKQVLALMIQKDHEEPTLWIAREVWNEETGDTELETLHKVPMRRLAKLTYLDFYGDYRFSLTIKRKDHDLIYRCGDEASARAWVEILNKAKSKRRTGSSSTIRAGGDLSSEDMEPDSWHSSAQQPRTSSSDHLSIEVPLDEQLLEEKRVVELEAKRRAAEEETQKLLERKAQRQKEEEEEAQRAKATAAAAAAAEERRLREEQTEAQKKREEEQRIRMLEEQRRLKQQQEIDAQRKREEQQKIEKASADEEKKKKQEEEERLKKEQEALEAKRRASELEKLRMIEAEKKRKAEQERLRKEEQRRKFEAENAKFEAEKHRKMQVEERRLQLKREQEEKIARAKENAAQANLMDKLKKTQTKFQSDLTAAEEKRRAEEAKKKAGGEEPEDPETARRRIAEAARMKLQKLDDQRQLEAERIKAEKEKQLAAEEERKKMAEKAAEEEMRRRKAEEDLNAWADAEQQRRSAPAAAAAAAMPQKPQTSTPAMGQSIPHPQTVPPVYNQHQQGVARSAFYQQPKQPASQQQYQGWQQPQQWQRSQHPYGQNQQFQPQRQGPSPTPPGTYPQQQPYQQQQQQQQPYAPKQQPFYQQQQQQAFHPQHPQGPNRAPPMQQQQRQQQNQAPQSPASIKYARQMAQTADDSLATESAIKRNILLHWGLQPPAMQVLRPLDYLLTNVQTVFPPAFGVAKHSYFEGFKPIPRADIVNGSTNTLDEDKLKKAVRKIRFFLHPDKLPRDLNDEQSFVGKLLWDIINDSFEEFKKSKEELDWIG